MSSYVILEPPEAQQKTERAVLVRDGFAFLAFLLPLLWFLWHRMWLEAAIVLLVTITLALLGGQLVYPALGTLLSLLLSLFIGMEAQNFRIHALSRRGWTIWGVVDGRDREEAELRYAAEADEAAEPQTAAPTSVPVTARPRARGAKTGSPFGLLDYPRRS